MSGGGGVIYSCQKKIKVIFRPFFLVQEGPSKIFFPDLRAEGSFRGGGGE